MGTMRSSWTIAAFTALLLGLGGTARAAEFAEGQLILKIGALPPITLPNNPEAATTPLITDLGGPIQEQLGAFGPGSVDLPDSLFTGVPQISDLRINGLGKPGTTATLTTGFATVTNPVGPSLAGGFGGAAPLQGTATICVLGCGNVAIQIPLSNAGAGGTTTKTFGGTDIIARNAAWTAAPAVVTVPSTTPGGRTGNPGVTVSHTANSMTGAGTTLAFKGHTTGSDAKGVTTVLQTMTASTTMLHAPNSNTLVTSLTTRQMTLTGFDGRDSSGVGTVQLVSPGRSDTGGQLADSLGVFAIQRLTFTPEPGAALLGGAAVATLVALGRSRRRRGDR